jgi:hypothetical protein
VGALGHYLEREGVPTAQVSLIREQTAAIKPPRALWVPFMLGRPFGVPNNAAFQRRVLLQLLHLFDAKAGPVLEDFPHEAPVDEGDVAGYACPVSFGAAAAATNDLGTALLDEIRQLGTWHDLARKRRGRSTVGISGMSIEAAARLVSSVTNDPTVKNPQPENSLGTVLKRCCDDIKAYYFEAAGAQPGQLSAKAIDHWFWHETAAGRVFLRLHAIGRAHPDKSVASVADRSLVPRAIQHTLGGAR